MIEGSPGYSHRDTVINIIMMLLSTPEKVPHALETPSGTNNLMIGTKH